MQKYRVERELAGKQLIIESGDLAQQAGGSVTVQYGDTVLLATATASSSPREGVDFFPLTVDFEERHYAIGKIPGSFFRREGRPGQDAILASRLTDRTIRPLFPKGYRNETQVVVLALSADQENIPDILSIIGTSAALTISDIPFAGPVSGTRLGYIDGEIVVNPTYSQLQESDLDLTVAGSGSSITMVEAGAKEIPEAVLRDALRKGQEVNGTVAEMQSELLAMTGKPKRQHAAAAESKALEAEVSDLVGGRLKEAAGRLGKEERNEATDELQQEAIDRFSEEQEASAIRSAFEAVLKDAVRTSILSGGRPDGRDLTEVRPISCQVGVLPRSHGSAIFNRGETQVLNVATLGPLAAAQKLDTLSPEESKRFLHHYNFPPFSVGEARRMGTPGRREIGHGALAERAITPVIPSEEDFPYTIRLVSDVLSSNGSTSMGSVCSSTLSLMDAGVPIVRPVAGIAMGLVTGSNGEYAVLTDIQGIEDFLGDMDFKVAGTDKGVTALQMDIKLTGVTDEILEKALDQARDARMFILDRMRETIAESRPELSDYAPRMIRLQINPERIGALIGPGGKTIRGIVEETKATVDVENDGTVYIGSSDGDAARSAIAMVEALTKEIAVGERYTGKVIRITDFGAFIELVPGRDGMVHISELANYRVPSVEDVLSLGDEVEVLVTDIDATGRVRLSRRALLDDSDPEQQEQAGPNGTDRRGDRDQPPHDSDRRFGGGDRGNGRPPRREGSGGPPGRRGDHLGRGARAAVHRTVNGEPPTIARRTYDGGPAAESRRSRGHRPHGSRGHTRGWRRRRTEPCGHGVAIGGPGRRRPSHGRPRPVARRDEA